MNPSNIKLYEMKEDMNDSFVAIVFHDNCADGMTAAALVERGLINQGVTLPRISFHAFSYKLITSDAQVSMLKPFDIIIVVDFFLPPSWITELVEDDKEKTIVVLDHHKTAYEIYKAAYSDFSYTPEQQEDYVISRHIFMPHRHVTIVMDMNLSGAGLALEFTDLQSDERIRDLVDLVQDYDLYEHKRYPSSTALHEVIRTFENPISKLSKYIAYPDVNIMRTWIDKGMAILAYRTKLVNIMAKQASPLTIETRHKHYDGMIVNAPYFLVNELGHKLAEKTKTFSVVWAVVGEDLQLSFRGVKGYDVSVIAALFGGGGHAGAAGAIIDNTTGKGTLFERIITELVPAYHYDMGQTCVSIVIPEDLEEEDGV